VRLTPGDKEIRISWNKVTSRTDGTPPPENLFYQVYRGTEDKGFVPVGEAVSGTEFRDLGLINGRPYQYKVRTVNKKGDNSVYGIFSSVATAAPLDLTPPIPPHNIILVRVVNGVKIMWDRGLEEDIAGYKIFRRSSAGEERGFVGTTGARQTFFEDRSAPEGQQLFYSVTSFDRARPANESLFSKEAQYEPF